MSSAVVATDDLDDLEPTIKDLIEHPTMQWIFVGGKGGVGKTTTSCSIAVRLAEVRENVLLISTDPAHNLSDAFGQKFNKEPTAVNGFDNLFCMEIDPEVDGGNLAADGVEGQSSGMASMFQELSTSIPGIDEAMSFAELMKQVQTMNYSAIVFDTAPTGHTLRLLSFPTVMEKAFAKIMALKDRFGGMLNQVAGMMGAGMPSQDAMLERLEQMRGIIQQVNTLFQDPEKTTFVCVCIPEFLSLYETERLVQELTKFGIDTHNIVVNQVLFPEPGCTCGKCLSRQKMQGKYLEQIYDLYEDFHVVTMPLLDAEVRGVPALRSFSRNLITPYCPPGAEEGAGETDASS